MQRVVITGASGFLGRYLLETAPATSQLLALANRNSIPSKSNISTLTLDLTVDSIDSIADFNPTIIYHLAALSGPGDCEQNPKLSAAITVESTRRLVAFAKQKDCRFVFTSTDLVFDGENALYDEFAVPQPINIYGEHKVSAENIVLSEMPERGVVVRCPLMYGRSVDGRENFTAGIVRKLKSREPVYLFTDEYRTPAWGRDVAAALWQIGASGDGGMFHAGGAERLSRFEMGEMICTAIGADRELLVELLRKDVNSAAARPHDCSLKSCRNVAGIPLPGFRNRIQQLLVELDQECV